MNILERGFTMDYAKIIGTNIRYERRRRGLTIDDFAKIIGMAPGFLGLIERGQRGTSIKNLVAMASFFDISMDELITKDLSNEGLEVRESDTTKAAKAKRALKSLVTSLNEEEAIFITSVIKSMNKMNRGVEE
jgi:transcriptional regulator with XRE-family HTH domain